MLILSLTMVYSDIFYLNLFFKKMLVKFTHDLLLSCNLQFEKHCPRHSRSWSGRNRKEKSVCEREEEEMGDEYVLERWKGISDSLIFAQ